MQKLIVGAGKYQRQEGWMTLDIHPFEGIDIVHDLNISPWPISDESFMEISAIHVVEHLNDLVSFMDECHRIICKGGSLYLKTPHADPDNFDLMFSDPTHKLFLRKHSFINYFTLSGIEKFGYTNKPWSLWHIEVLNGELIVHAEPIKR